MSYILVVIGLASPLLALLLAIGFYFGSRRGRAVESSFLRYAAGWVGVASVSGLVVAALGRPLCEAFQFPEETWGWVIPLFLIPFLTSIAVTTYCIFWITRKFAAAPEIGLSSATEVVLSSATKVAEITDEEAGLMQRWNIFFNGKQYRLGTLEFNTLAEALAAANNVKAEGDER